MIEIDSLDHNAPDPSPVREIPSIAQMARGSKENLMAITFSQRPKTPMRTYVVSGMLMSALGISLGFGIYLMFNPDHTEYSAGNREGTESVEVDQALIMGARKVVPMHNAPTGHNPTFGMPRSSEIAPATQAPISTNVPPPLVNHLPALPANQFVPSSAPLSGYAPGAASASVPYQPLQTQGPMQPSVFNTPQLASVNAQAALPQLGYPLYQPVQAPVMMATPDNRLKTVTNR